MAIVWRGLRRVRYMCNINICGRRRTCKTGEGERNGGRRRDISSSNVRRMTSHLHVPARLRLWHFFFCFVCIALFWRFALLHHFASHPRFAAFAHRSRICAAYLVGAQSKRAACNTRVASGQADSDKFSGTMQEEKSAPACRRGRIIYLFLFMISTVYVLHRQTWQIVIYGNKQKISNSRQRQHDGISGGRWNALSWAESRQT